MKRYFNTIQMRMFRTYAMIIILMVVFLSLFINRFVFGQLREHAYNSSISMVEAQSSFLDQEVEKMDSLALGILCSFVIKDYLSSIGKSDVDESELVEKGRNVSKQLASILAPYFTVQQVMLHDLTGKIFTSYSGYYKKSDIRKVSWFSDVVDREGLMFLTEPYSGDDRVMSSDITNSEIMISLCRTAFDNYGVERGIVEVKQYKQKMFRNLNTLYKNSQFQNVAVINDKSSVIYHSGVLDETDTADIFKALERIPLNTPGLINHGKNIIFYQRSKYSGLTLVLIQSKSTVMKSATTFLSIISLSALTVLILALLISYYAARQITAPINELRLRIHNTDTDILEVDTSENSNTDTTSGLIEIDDLNDTFNTMSLKLKESIDNQILAHRLEIQYKMLALQSQMNPHFLYNSIAMISAMAEENLTEEISYTCKNLSSMLRYAASGKDNIVTLKTELEQTENYLETSRLRFKDKLNFSFDIEPATLDCEIPKLSIQPLVENSIKYCSRKRPPWNIHIKSVRDKSGWYVAVSDNGSGISDSALQELSKKIEKIDKQRILPPLELNGMGLLNVYIRLNMMHKDSTVFSIEQKEGGGTVITIGCRNQTDE